MAFDGIVLAAVTKELQVLIGCRIEKFINLKQVV